MDGRKQRQAVTAAEQAIRALAGGDVAKARVSARRAEDLDQVGIYAGLELAVAADDAWDAVAAVLGSGPLAAEVEELRSAGGRLPPPPPSA